MSLRKVDIYHGKRVSISGVILVLLKYFEAGYHFSGLSLFLDLHRIADGQLLKDFFYLLKLDVVVFVFGLLIL